MESPLFLVKTGSPGSPDSEVPGIPGTRTSITLLVPGTVYQVYSIVPLVYCTWYTTRTPGTDTGIDKKEDHIWVENGFNTPGTVHL